MVFLKTMFSIVVTYRAHYLLPCFMKQLITKRRPTSKRKKAVSNIKRAEKDQSTHSLDYQEKSIRDYCDRNDLILGPLCIDDGESSYTFDRPDYRALETFIRNNQKSVRYLVVFDHDRFSRNLPEALQKIEFLEKKSTT